MDRRTENVQEFVLDGTRSKAVDRFEIECSWRSGTETNLKSKNGENFDLGEIVLPMHCIHCHTEREGHICLLIEPVETERTGASSL
jgi:hypothetical protein